MAADSYSSSAKSLSSDGHQPQLQKRHQHRSAAISSPASASPVTTIKAEHHSLAKDTISPNKKSYSHRPDHLTVETSSDSDELHLKLARILGPKERFLGYPEISINHAVGVIPQPSTPVSCKDPSSRQMSDHGRGSSKTSPDKKHGSGENTSNNLLVVDAKSTATNSSKSSAVKTHQVLSSAKPSVHNEVKCSKTEGDRGGIKSATSSPNIVPSTHLHQPRSESQRQPDQHSNGKPTNSKASIDTKKSELNMKIFGVMNLSSSESEDSSESDTEAEPEKNKSSQFNKSEISSGTSANEKKGALSFTAPTRKTGRHQTAMPTKHPARQEPIKKPTFTSPKSLTKKVDDISAIYKDVTLPSPLPTLLSPVGLTHDLPGVTSSSTVLPKQQFSPVLTSETTGTTPFKAEKRKSNSSTSQYGNAAHESPPSASQQERTVSPTLCQQTTSAISSSYHADIVKVEQRAASPPLPNLPAPSLACPSLLSPIEDSKTVKLEPVLTELKVPDVTVKRKKDSKTHSSSKTPKVRRVVESGGEKRNRNKALAKSTPKKKEDKEKEKEKEKESEVNKRPSVTRSSQTSQDQIVRGSHDCGFLLEGHSQTSWDLRAAFTTNAFAQTCVVDTVEKQVQTDQTGDLLTNPVNSGTSQGLGGCDSFGPSAPKQARRETACVQPLSVVQSNSPANTANAGASSSQAASNPQLDSLRSKFTIKPKATPTLQPESMSPYDGALERSKPGVPYGVIDWRGTFTEQTLQSEKTYFDRGRLWKREADQEFPRQRNLDSFCIYLDAMLAFLLQVCAYESTHGGKAEAKRRSQLLTFIDEALSKCAPSARDLTIDPRWDIPLALCHQAKAVLATRLYDMQSRETLLGAAQSVERHVASANKQQAAQSPPGSVGSSSSHNSSSSSKAVVYINRSIEMVTNAFRLLEASKSSWVKAEELADKHRSFFDRFTPTLTLKASLLDLSSYLDRSITDFRALRNATASSSMLTGPAVPCSSKTPLPTNGRSILKHASSAHK